MSPEKPKRKNDDHPRPLFNRKLWIYVLIIMLIIVTIIVALALVGPLYSNIYSNLAIGLNP